MILTSIERQKRRASRISLFLDEEFWLGMTERLFEELDLRRGQEISDKQKKEIEAEVIQDGALEYALARLADRAYTEEQIKDRLLRKGYGEEIAELVLDRCRELHLLDDTSLAETLIEERKSRGYGRRWLQSKLREIGISPDTSKELLDKAFKDEGEESLATAALQKRYGTDSLLPDEEKRATDFLVRRGFSASAARSATQKQRADEETQAKEYGKEKAQEYLRKRYGSRLPEKDKARGFLARKGFSSAVIQQTLQEWE